jgi:hypothetical protein
MIEAGKKVTMFHVKHFTESRQFPYQFSTKDKFDNVPRETSFRSASSVVQKLISRL